MIRTDHPLDVVTENRSLTEHVVVTVADAKGVDPTALEPLHRVVDPDALNRLFASTDDGHARASGQVTFTYAGCEVVVDGTGDVDATPRE